MLNSHGSNPEVRLTAANTTLFNFGFQDPENTAALPVKRENIHNGSTSGSGKWFLSGKLERNPF